MKEDKYKYLPKFYDLETLTQEDLNRLALERNTLVKENERLNNIIDELEKMFDGDLDGFRTINEKGACNDILEVIEIYKDKLKELKEGK